MERASNPVTSLPTAHPRLPWTWPVGVFSWLLLSAAIAILGAVCIAEDAYISLLISASAIVAPFLVFVAIQALKWREPYASIACTVITVLLTTVFRIRAIDDKSIDYQILIKIVDLGLLICMTITAFCTPKRTRNTIFRPIQYIPLLLFMLFECANAVNTSVAIVEVFSNMAALLFVIAIAERLGPRSLVRILIQAGLWLCLISILVYFVDPQLGRMIDWVDNAYVTTSRLQGVFGTSNSAGASAAFCLLIVLLFDGRNPSRLDFVVKIGAFAIVLWASNNRMALLVFTCIMAIYVLRRHAEKLALAIGIGAAAVLILIYLQFGDGLLASLSRTGNIDEIAGGNGRLQIWSVVVDLWSQRPLLGYGVGSAKFILPHHPLLFGAAAHAHSLYLNVLFSGGLLGAIFLATGFVTAIVSAWRRQSDQMLMLVAYFMVYGLTEPLIGGLASFITIAFFSTLLLCRLSHGLVPLNVSKTVKHRSLNENLLNTAI